MGYNISLRAHRAFALPTVLIASVVLLTVLSVSVSATTAVRNTLKDQYYAQLAQVAGEAGVQFAEACLQANNNVMTWSSEAPLTPATDCFGVNRSGITCPLSDQCWVSINGNIRSSFRVTEPEYDIYGRPSIIPQTGYVELWRTTTQTPWRVYNQPQAIPAVAPDLCSGAAASNLGWNNAVVTSSTGTFVSQSTAKPIDVTNGNRLPGPVYLRKDFSVPTSRQYVIQSMTSDRAQVYLDGSLVQDLQTANSIATYSPTLSAGCHSVQVVLNNQGLVPNPANFLFSVRDFGGTQDIVISDGSWRVASGDSKGFSEVGYYQSTAWENARSLTSYGGAPFGAPSQWTTITGDTSASWISSMAGVTSISGSTYYYQIGHNYFRSNNQSAWTMSGSNVEVQVALACDNKCAVFIDGVQVVFVEGATSNLGVSKVTLVPGPHNVGVWLENTASGSSTGFIFSAKLMSNGVVIDRSSSSWLGTNTWSSSPQDFRSYDTGYTPSTL